MTDQPHNQADTVPNWKQQSYLVGTFIGAFLGFLSAYLFAREAEDSDEDEQPKLSSSAMLGLTLSALGLVRQIAESGRKPKKKK